MKRLVLFLSIVTATLLALPAFAANDAITGIQWGRNSKDFDAMASGPKPLKNLNRDENGIADDHALVGDYRNPILTPYAAAIVKHGPVADVTLEIAAATHADLIVMGRSGGLTIRPSPFGSTLRTVLHRTACSVSVTMRPT